MTAADAQAPATPSAWRTVAGAVLLWQLASLDAGMLLAPRLSLLAPSPRLAAWSAVNVALLLAAAVLGRRAAGDPLDLRGELSTRPAPLAAAAGLGVATAAVNLGVNWAISELRGGQGLALSGASAGIADAAASWPHFWLSAGLLVAVAPPTEELFYRGFVQRSLGAGRWPAMAASALLFWNFHTHGLWTPAPFVLGLALAVLYARTGSLGAAMACHAANNAAAVLVAATLRLARP